MWDNRFKEVGPGFRIRVGSGITVPGSGITLHGIGSSLRDQGSGCTILSDQGRQNVSRFWNQGSEM